MYIYIYVYIYYIYVYYIYILYIYYIGTQAKCTSRWKQSSGFKQLLETLLLAVKGKGMHWIHHRFCMGEHKSVQCHKSVLEIRRT